MSSSMIDRVYGAKTRDEQEATYDAWSAQYERDLFAMGYRLPAVAAAIFAQHVPVDVGPILDAGCGGGLQAEPLVTLGYGPIVGIDLSAGMLAVAREKGLYAELRQMALGGRLDFSDNRFAAILSIGTITPGHAPAESFDDLIRIARPRAPIVFSLRSDGGQDPKYPEACARLEADKQWRRIVSTAEFVTMPYSEPEIKTRVHVYEVL
ncbi:MAG: class I SAM-dependent DNA methyltransferase [Geminicoccaceae bacterium]